MSTPIVEELERRFLPLFREKAGQLEREFPSVRITTWSSSTGSATSYQGHDLGIDCKFPDAPIDQCDNVALIIGVMHLTTEPKLCDACVCWGADAGADWRNTDLLQFPVSYSKAALDEIEAGLPTLYEALATAISNYPFSG